MWTLVCTSPTRRAGILMLVHNVAQSTGRCFRADHFLLLLNASSTTEKQRIPILEYLILKALKRKLFCSVNLWIGINKKKMVYLVLTILTVWKPGPKSNRIYTWISRTKHKKNVLEYVYHICTTYNVVHIYWYNIPFRD